MWGAAEFPPLIFHWGWCAYSCWENVLMKDVSSGVWLLAFYMRAFPHQNTKILFVIFSILWGKLNLWPQTFKNLGCSPRTAYGFLKAHSLATVLRKIKASYQGMTVISKTSFWFNYCTLCIGMCNFIYKYNGQLIKHFLGAFSFKFHFQMRS